jgi:hypothetical protein
MGTLAVEDGPGEAILFGSIVVGVGAIAAVLGWSQGPNWIFVIVGVIFVLVGLKIALFARKTTHRFERGRGHVSIDSKGLWGSDRYELRLDDIVDVVLDEVRRKSTSYQVFYITANGERVAWSDDYTNSKDDKLECMQAVREFLGISNAPAGVDSMR